MAHLQVADPKPRGVLNLLFVTYFFPPFRSVGAVRTGQTASQLGVIGHDVQVLTAAGQLGSRDLPLEVPSDHVHATSWLGRRLTHAVSSHQAATIAKGPERGPARPGAADSARRTLRLVQRNLIYMPDDCIGWYPFALREGMRLVRSRPIDLVYASAGPLTSLLVAASLARCAGVPWVGELRDLWSDNHYRDLAAWFHAVDERVERRVLRTARGLVTVSEPWAESLRSKYAVPVCTVYNGFRDDRTPLERAPDPDAPLRMAYLGTLYGGKRDPTPLFRAIRALGEDSCHVRVEFYGPHNAGVERLARDCGVQERVVVAPEVSYAESLAIQSSADVLLLVMWNTPEEAGVLPGKLFEYLGAGRPTLAVGAPDGAVSALVAQRGLGLASSDPSVIATRLRAWIAEKRSTGRVRSLPAAAVRDFSRARQVEKLSDFLLMVHDRSLHSGLKTMSSVDRAG